MTFKRQRYSTSSLTLDYVLSSFSNCNEKKTKFRKPCRMPMKVVLRYKSKRPIYGREKSVITKTISPKRMSLTSNFNSTVETVAFDRPLATLICNSGGGPSFTFVYGARNHILFKRTTGTGLANAVVFLKPSMVTSAKLLEKGSTLRFFFAGRSVDIGRNFLSPTLVNWSFGFDHQWLDFECDGFEI